MVVYILLQAIDANYQELSMQYKLTKQKVEYILYGSTVGSAKLRNEGGSPKPT